MKGAYANGVLTAFEEAGHHPWKAVYGTSAGGAMAAWYSAGQAKFAEQTWAFARDPTILSYRRFFTGRGPLLDHELLLDRVYVADLPFDVAALRRAKWPVIVTASDVQTGKAHYEDIRDGPVLEWLKATGRLPFASGDPVTIDGRSYLDGGITDPIPVRKAVEDGHTDITLVLNESGIVRKDAAVLAKMTARRYPALRDGILRHAEIKAEAVAYAEKPPQGVTVRIIRPETPTGLHRLSRDLKVIQSGLKQGHADGQQYLASQTSG